MEERELRKEAERAVANWGAYKVYGVKKKIEYVHSLILQWCKRDGIPNDINTVMKQFIEELENNVKSAKEGKTTEAKGYRCGYMYFFDEVDKFMKNPNILWQVYDRAKDKKAFFSNTFVRYTSDEEQNTEMFNRDSLKMAMSREGITPAEIENFDENQRRVFLEKVIKHVKAEGIFNYRESVRISTLKLITETVRKLEKLGVLPSMIETYNNNMKRIGFEAFSFSEDIVAVDGDRIFGIDLRSCSVFQLQAMLSFYMNRLEKVQEDIGLGLFMINYFSDENGMFNIESLSEEVIKIYLKKYSMLSAINEEMMVIYYNYILEHRGSFAGFDFEKTYDNHMRKYFKMYFDVLGIECDTHNISEEKMMEIFKLDFTTFQVINTANRENNYLIKTRFVEDLILASIKDKRNWGIMQDGESGYKLKRFVLLGFDVPEMNMPLRLHYPLDKIRVFMKEYLKTEEVPLYVGQNDFDIVGEYSGTQFLFPMNPEQKRFVRVIPTLDVTEGNQVRNSRDKKRVQTKVTPDTIRRARHLSCMSIPNMRERLLAVTTDRTQKYPDYINVFTGDIIRTPRIVKKTHHGDTTPNGR